VGAVYVQRGRQLRGDADDEGDDQTGRRRALGAAGDLQELLYDERRVLSVRRAALHDEVQLVDLRRQSGQLAPLQLGRVIRSRAVHGIPFPWDSHRIPMGMGVVSGY